MTPRLSTVVLTAFLCFVLAASAMAATKERPKGGDIAMCHDDSQMERTSDLECDGLLCTCCYTDGCFICDNLQVTGGTDPNCVWEPKFRRGSAGQTTGGAIGGGVLDPGPLTQPRISPIPRTGDTAQ